MRFNHLPPIYFLHLARTAGTSFRLWLSDFFGEEDRLDADHRFDVVNLDAEILRERSFFSGHFGYEFAHRLRAAVPDVAIVTLLRKPVERELSAFRYATTYRAEFAAKTWVGPWHRAFKQHPELSPQELVGTAAYLGGSANYQVRELAGCNENGAEYHEVSARDLESAKTNLASMGMFGLTEELHRSTALFCDRFDLPLRQAPSMSNETPVAERDSAVEQARSRIEETNTVDNALYAFARELFDKRYESLLARYGVAPGTAEEEFAALQPRFLDRFLSGSSCPAVPATQHIDMADGLLFEGLAARFYYEPLHRWLRWTTLGRDCVIYLPLGPGGTLKLALEIAYLGSEEIRDALRFRVETEELSFDIRYDRWDDGAYHLVAEVEIPGALRRGGYTPFNIATRHAAQAAAGDDRRGLCLSRIATSVMQAERDRVASNAI